MKGVGKKSPRDAGRVTRDAMAAQDIAYAHAAGAKVTKWQPWELDPSKLPKSPPKKVEP